MRQIYQIDCVLPDVLPCINKNDDDDDDDGDGVESRKKGSD